MKLANSLFLAVGLLISVPQGYAEAVSLKDIVVGIHPSETSYALFPMRALSGYGELYLEPFHGLTLSEDCSRENILVDREEETVSCLPSGDEDQAFVFARFSEERRPRRESDSGWLVVFLDFDLERVKLVATPNLETQRFEYRLELH